MQKWEYFVTFLSFEEQEELNKLGQEGWELVNLMFDEDGNLTAYFKRPLDPIIPPFIIINGSADFDKLRDELSKMWKSFND